MNKMKLSAIVLGIAAAGAFAQNAPAAAPAAAPAQPAAEAQVANADSVKAAEEAKAAEAKKAEEAKAAEAKKAEEEKAAAEAKKAEEEKAAAEAKKAEEEKAAAEAKKAEEEKAAESQQAEAAPAAAEDKGEVSAAASQALSSISSSMSEGTSAAKMEVKMTGEVEFDMYTNDIISDDKLRHSYATTVDLNFDVKFNEKWSAFLGIEADAASEGAEFGYNGAWVKYQPAEIFAIKFGDLTFSEGAFVSYYGYDDPTYYAAGMKEHDIRGLQIELAGLELGFGFGRGSNDGYGVGGNFLEEVGLDAFSTDRTIYNAHVAYEFNYAGQHLRPYFDYKSYQTEDHNEMHAGIDAGLNIGGFSFRAVYGFHANFLLEDDDAKSLAGKNDLTSAAHTILAEPSFELGIFQIKTAFFIALTDDSEGPVSEYYDEIPESMLIYAEPALKLAGFIKLGIPVEFHTNAMDFDSDNETLDVGVRTYIAPVENLDIMATAMIDIGIGDNAPVEGDLGLRLGLETVFKF